MSIQLAQDGAEMDEGAVDAIALRVLGGQAPRLHSRDDIPFHDILWASTTVL
jgi:hypothetical protein